MIENFLNEILGKYSVSDSFSKGIREKYRKNLEFTLSQKYNLKPKIRYGGSLSKGTANTNSCDIDLLCYLPADEQLSIEGIFKTAEESLSKSGYIFQTKNSAICVKGIFGQEDWPMTVDVVPGKYTSNEGNKDVYLWCNRDKCRLKSNPELQIDKVKNSNSKDVIRLIKLFRTFNVFSFKSFFLENFAIDVVEPDFSNDDSIMDKIVKFCSHWDEIGRVKIYDPANKDNDIMQIHDEAEFSIIREKIHFLYEALMTNNEETIRGCFLGNPVSIERGYLVNAKSHSPRLEICENRFYFITLNGYIVKENKSIQFSSNTILKKEECLKFVIKVPNSIQVKNVKLIVSNAGFEANKKGFPRGNEEQTEIDKTSVTKTFYRKEETSYYGNHVVQAIVYSKTGGTFLSDYLIVRVR